MKRVPEEQVAALQAKVALLDSFQHSRGKWGKPLADILAEYVATTENPTQCLQAVEALCSRLKVIADKAAQLRSAGHDAAVAEMIDALQYPEKRLPWETTAPCPKTTITLFMPDPVRTLAIVNFLVLGKLEDLYREDLMLENANPLVRRLLEEYPTLQSDCSHRVDRMAYGFDVWRAYELRVESMFMNEVVECLRKFPAQKLCLSREQYDPRFLSGVWKVCYVVHAPAKVVLACFTREQQGRLGVWQLDVPKHCVEGGVFSCFGFHPKNEHHAWREQVPDFTSIGTACGLGVVQYSHHDQNLNDEIDRTHLGWQNDPPALRFQVS